MRGNEVVNTDLFNIRSWFIKKNLRNISGSNSRNDKELWVCLDKRVSFLKKRVLRFTLSKRIMIDEFI